MNRMPLPSITGIDTHAHIFRQDLPLTEHRRYSPAYDALVADYLAHLECCGLSHGVLVQPSFLGTDNHHMLEALRAYPERLRGIAVVEPSISEAELDELDRTGVVGIRLNLIGQSVDDYASSLWQSFFKRLAQRGWSVEIQREMEDLALILPPILQTGVAVVVDHFGLPKGGCIDPNNVRHEAFLALLNHEKIWIKLSATYRSQSTPTQALLSLDKLRKAYGNRLDRLLWGSDWPHTRFEDQTNYTEQFELLTLLLPDPAERAQVLKDNPARLFKFKQPA